MPYIRCDAARPVRNDECEREWCRGLQDGTAIVSGKKSPAKQWSEGRVSNIDISGKGFTYVFVIISVSYNPSRIFHVIALEINIVRTLPSKSTVFTSVINALRWYVVVIQSRTFECTVIKNYITSLSILHNKNKIELFSSRQRSYQRIFSKENESRFAKSCHEPKVGQISVERIERVEVGRKREPKGETLAEVRLARPEW